MSLPPLAAADLAPFATLVRAEGGKFTTIPEVLEPGDVPGQHAFAVLCPQPVDPQAISITFLERHPHSTQTFVPLTVGRWIVESRERSASEASAPSSPALKMPCASIAMSGMPASPCSIDRPKWG